jgi:2-oxoglutarate ferredoxin oxidoreductase subunit beta
LVEVMQNCNVFNDGAWDVIRDKKTGSVNQLWLEHGKPLTFGPEGSLGLRLRAGSLDLETVKVGEGGVTESDLLVHDETNRAQAFLLAQLQVPVPMGVLFAIDAPNYDADVRAQREQQVERHGVGEMHELLRRGHTWTVD